MTTTELDTSHVTPSESEHDESGWDWPLFGAVALLAAFGLLVILSASSADADRIYGYPFHYIARQSIGLGIGCTLAGVLLTIPWRWLRRSIWPSYLVSLGLLVAVLSPMGHSAKGATRWLALGPMNFQPSELAKLALIAALAHYLACNEGRLKDVVGVAVPGLSLLLPLVALIVFQKDFGTTVILLGLTGVLLFVAGLQKRWLVGGAALAVCGLVAMVLAEPYRIKRLTAFLDPFADPDAAGYQIVQGWIALATGGATGNGMAAGVAQRGFLPEPHTDFISAVIGEELGAIGWTIAVGLQMFLVWRVLEVGERARDLFGTLVCTGVAVLFGSQAIINLGVVAGMLPAKGLVLPFLSYGASAVIVHALAVGFVLRIGLESKREVS
ncbi:MAG: cell division protein FtsW [Myxococcota bacterium]|jgi:cell division protein FtsW